MRPVKERPILFSGPMIRAILEGRKTQTRRALNPQPTLEQGDGTELRDWSWPCGNGGPSLSQARCPYGVSGERLLFRETLALEDPDQMVWTPFIYMPRLASRITLEIVDVRVQRLQDIGAFDAIEEGVQRSTEPFDAREPFRLLWDSINAKRGFGWDSNPWVWALTFRRAS